MPSDQEYLLLALKEAEKRRGLTSPNPAVGAILVEKDNIISTGTHLIAGAPHAEVMALEKIKNVPENSTLYVTLEPCCHHGKTPPCTDLILEKKIKQVVFGYLDPNPLVSGKGKEILEKNRVHCRFISLPEINSFYESYQYWTLNKKPFVTAKLAITLDGKIAGKDGMPIKITGPQLDAFTHLKRKHADAILTTIRTVIKDNPKLNVRFDGEVLKKPIYILDKNLDLPLNVNLFSTAEKITLFCLPNPNPEKKQKLTSLGVEVIEVEEKNGLLSLPKVLSWIGEMGKHDLWVEAGSTLFTELINQKLTQSAYIYISPTTTSEKGTPAFDIASPNLSHSTKLTWKTFNPEICLEIKF